jgi:hypothetical protein
LPFYPTTLKRKGWKGLQVCDGSVTATNLRNQLVSLVTRNLLAGHILKWQAKLNVRTVKVGFINSALLTGASLERKHPSMIRKKNYAKS